MPTARQLTLALTLAAALVAPAAAQNLKLRPGLWEFSVTMKAQSGQMEAAMAQARKSMAQMPPAQRKQMEQMMAQQGVGIAADGAQVVRICMTPQDTEMDQIPVQEGCTQKVARVNANTVKSSYSCKGGQGEPPSSGEGTITLESDTAFSGKHRMSTTADGKPEQMELTQKGRWLAADCGKIKPKR